MSEKIDVERTIQNSASLKPKELIISDLKWKYLVRAVLRSKNVMIIGPSGCAKCLGPDTNVDVMVNDVIFEKIMKNRTLR